MPNVVASRRLTMLTTWQGSAILHKLVTNEPLRFQERWRSYQPTADCLAFPPGYRIHDPHRTCRKISAHASESGVAFLMKMEYIVHGLPLAGGFTSGF
jgi:hypothetical protein